MFVGLGTIFALDSPEKEGLLLKRLIVGALLLSFLPVFAENYADRQLKDLAQWVENWQSGQDPVTALLKAEQIYLLSHEASEQALIADTLGALFAKADHGELKAGVGYYFIQQCRQLGRFDAIENAVKALGYLEDVQVLGPLAPTPDLELGSLLSKPQHPGLGRDVSWLPLRAYGADDYWNKGLGHFGFFATSQAIYPSQSAGTLVTTWFYVPKRVEVRLGLGWSQHLRAWVNQTEVFNEKTEQKAFPDQAVVNLKVKKGWHRLSLYVESQGDNLSLGYFARLTDTQGNPLKVVAAQKTGLPKKRVTLKPGSEQKLLALAQQNSDAALGGLLLIRQSRNHPEFGSAKELLGKAFATEKTRDITEKFLSLAADANEKWEILTAFQEQATGPEEAPQRAWAQTQLGQIALEQGRFWEARHLAERALAESNDYWPARLLENNTFATLGLDGQALHQTLKLAEKRPKTPWIMMDLCDLYWSMNYRTEAEALVDDILEMRQDSVKFAERKMDLLKSRGDLDALDGFFKSVVRKSPYAMSNVLAYAEFLSNNRLFEQAETLLSGYLKQTPENPFLLEAMGEVRLINGMDDGLDYLEKALALRPQNPELENLIALSQAEQERFYEPFLIDAAPDVDVLEISPIVVNYDNQVRKVSSSGQSSLFHQIEYEIQDEQANQELPGYSFSYAPLRQKAKILKAEITRGDQTILLTQHGRSRISDPAYRMYYDLVAYQIAFPNLEVGDRIQIQYRIDDIASKNIYGDYFGDFQYFSKRYPARRLAYTIVLPKDREIYYHVEKMKPVFKDEAQGENRVLSWAIDQVSPYETEARMPGLTGYLPYLSLSSFKDWQDMASWYATLIKDQLKLDHETKKLVAELTQGVTDPLEIVKIIHEYVVTNTRYVALEFGIHGYKPYQVNQVCSRQFGDCKDKASLLVSMLKEAGVDANIVIVRTSDEGEVNPYPASLRYFNHAIAYVPKFDLFLDGTAEFSGIRELPEMDQGGLCLIVDENGKGELRKIPVYDENQENFMLSVAVRADGDAEVSGELSFAGISNPDLRQYLSLDSQLPANLQTLMVDMLPGLDVREAKREGRRINEPISLKFQGVSSQLMEASGSQWKLPLDILNSRLIQKFAPNARRKFPLSFGPPQIREVTLQIDAPQGYTFTSVPDTIDLENDNLSIRISFDKSQDSQCKVNYRLAFKTYQVEPEDYGKVRDLMQAHDRVLEQAIFVGTP